MTVSRSDLTASCRAPDAVHRLRQRHPRREDAVEQVLRAQQDAWNRHDLEAFMSGYWNSPELTFFSGAQRTSGWQGALDRYRQMYQSEGKEMGKLEFSGLQIEPLGRRRRLRTRSVASQTSRRQNSARPVHARIPEVSRRLEDHPRPHVAAE